jgi:hypothetical protein
MAPLDEALYASVTNRLEPDASMTISLGKQNLAAVPVPSFPVPHPPVRLAAIPDPAK